MNACGFLYILIEALVTLYSWLVGEQSLESSSFNPSALSVALHDPQFLVGLLFYMILAYSPESFYVVAMGSRFCGRSGRRAFRIF